MKLKIRILSRIMSANNFITIVITMLIVATMGFAISGCTPPQETRQLVIPSELEPEAVLPGLSGDIFNECVYEVGSDTNKCHDVEFFAELDELENGFIKGYARSYVGYTLKSGQYIGPAYTLLRIRVLKYRTPEAAEVAFNLFSDLTELKYIIFDGVKVKWQHHPKEPLVYMLQSNNFIILIDGSVEPCKDALSRIIELYSVPISKDN